ncbi:MAG: hypothetical protein QMD00_00400 [Hadesarchaea archaeon]|nr:hypothetical protein [Hadesarchaea archaeon]
MLMKIVWCKELEDVVNIARSQGWLFYSNLGGKHYFYVYAGTEAELLCIAVEGKEPLKAKYVSIDDDGNLKTSDKPIMPACAKIMNVVKDEGFEGLLK